MKNLFRCFVALAATIVSMELFGTCVIVDTYDQLGNHIGEDGVFLVRDAGNTKTGQHGDPSVKSGYAYYTWDTRANAWMMVGKEELLKLANVDFSQLLTKELYLADQDDMRRKMATYEAHYNSATQTIASLVATLTALTNSFDVATVDYLLTENTKLRASLVDITNTVIHVDSSFGELKGAVSNICASASYALGGPKEFRYKENDPEPEPEPTPEPQTPAEPAPTDP